MLNSKHTIGIVGSRKCTDYGRKVTKEFASELSKKGVCVISGMAIGIDGIEHDIALEKQGKTIAVLGGGFNHIYPKENEWLFNKILEKGGCIISEYLPDTEPNKNNFPIRNRIISGLSDAVLVVEATFRSGSSITAKYAFTQGKKVYSIPNNIYADTGIGTNLLIQEGANLVTKPKQIIENMEININENKNSDNVDIKRINSTSKKKQKRENNKEENNFKPSISGAGNNLIKTIPKEYLQIYRIVSEVPIHINEIAIRLNKSIQEINTLITMMELDGYIHQVNPNYYTIKK